MLTRTHVSLSFEARPLQAPARPRHRTERSIFDNTRGACPSSSRRRRRQRDRAQNKNVGRRGRRLKDNTGVGTGAKGGKGIRGRSQARLRWRRFRTRKATSEKINKKSPRRRRWWRHEFCVRFSRLACDVVLCPLCVTDRRCRRRRRRSRCHRRTPLRARPCEDNERVTGPRVGVRTRKNSAQSSF